MGTKSRTLGRQYWLESPPSRQQAEAGSIAGPRGVDAMLDARDPSSQNGTLMTQPQIESPAHLQPWLPEIDWMPSEIGGEFAQLFGWHFDLVQERTQTGQLQWYVTAPIAGGLQEERITSYCDSVDQAKHETVEWISQSFPRLFAEPEHASASLADIARIVDGMERGEAALAPAQTELGSRLEAQLKRVMSVNAG